MKSRTVLIVEDEPKLAQVLVEYLNAAGYETEWLDNGSDVIPWLRQHQPDLMVLDLMLPGRGGLEICSETRSFSEVPIIMATARIEEIDRLIGLELGADDYLCKPYSPRELVARIKAIFRRIDYMQSGVAAPAGLEIHADHMEVRFDGHKLTLTAVEFRLIRFLAANPGRVYSRGQLLDKLYDDHRVVSDRTVDSHIKNLRKKLSDIAPDRDIIKSIYGVGYKLEF
jgi:two-component system response regulator BaeR